eukprot:291161-Chlamydomonas_euryale.AAC.3
MGQKDTDKRPRSPQLPEGKKKQQVGSKADKHAGEACRTGQHPARCEPVAVRGGMARRRGAAQG